MLLGMFYDQGMLLEEGSKSYASDNSMIFFSTFFFFCKKAERLKLGEKDHGRD